MFLIEVVTKVSYSISKIEYGKILTIYANPLSGFKVSKGKLLIS